MPVPISYPGVYVEEIPSGVRTISGVSTSVTAFVGRARKGPLDEPITIFNFGDYQRKFGGLWEKSPMSFAVRDFFLNGGGEAVIVRVYNPLDANTSGLSTIRYELGDGGNDGDLVLEAANPGTWGDNLSVKVDHVENNNDLFNISITEKDGASEKFLNVSVNPQNANNLEDVLKQGSNLIKVAELSSTRPSAGDTDATGGNDGLHIGDAQISALGLSAGKKGLYALEKTDIFNLLCIPPYTNSTGGDPGVDGQATDVTNATVAAATKYCEGRRAMLIVDPHSTWDNQGAVITNSAEYPGNPNDYAAIFFPRLKQANPIKNNQIDSFVPCGAVAGVIARTDTQRGIWKAPAGTDATLAGVNGFTVSLTDEENGKLNQLGINCLRSFPVYGRLIWGARTLAGADQLASEWKYIPVRRTALFIEESLFRGLKWVVFEPNDEPLWAQIRLNVGAFMHNLFRQGAFQGKKKEAYFVKCDAETTTQNDINNGIVNILVGFAPLKPAEFVIIKLQQLAGQVES